MEGVFDTFRGGRKKAELQALSGGKAPTTPTDGSIPAVHESALPPEHHANVRFRNSLGSLTDEQLAEELTNAREWMRRMDCEVEGVMQRLSATLPHEKEAYGSPPTGNETNGIISSNRTSENIALMHAFQKPKTYAATQPLAVSNVHAASKPTATTPLSKKQKLVGAFKELFVRTNRSFPPGTVAEVPLQLLKQPSKCCGPPGRCLTKTFSSIDTPTSDDSSAKESDRAPSPQNPVITTSRKKSEWKPTEGCEFRTVDQQKWDSQFALLEAYKTEHGDCAVPQSHAIGKWVTTQKQLLRKFTEGKVSDAYLDRIQRLERVGLGTATCGPAKFHNTENIDKLWMAKYEELLTFKALNGHVNVSHATHRSLYSWVEKNRQEMIRHQSGESSGAMTQQRMGKLLSAGVVLQKKDSFETRLQQLIDYQKEHGNTRVPVAYKGHNNLGKWCIGVRRRYQQKSGSEKTDPCFERLESIGFDFAKRKRGMAGRTQDDTPSKSSIQQYDADGAGY